MYKKKTASHKSLLNLDSAGFASTQEADIPYSGVQVTQHTTEQAVITNNSQHFLNNPEAGKREKKTQYVSEKLSG